MAPDGGKAKRATVPRVAKRLETAPAAKTGLGIALVLLASFFLAATPTLARVAYDHGSDAATVSLARFVVSAFGFTVLMKIRGESYGGDRRLLIGGIVIGLCYTVQTVAYLSSVNYVTVPVAVLVFFTFPVIAALMVRLVDGAALSGTKWAAVIVAFAGVALATGASPQMPDPRGLSLAFLAAIGTAAYIVYGGGISRRSGPIVINALSLSIAAALMIANAVLISPAALPGSLVGWLGLAGSGVFFLVGILAFFSALVILDTLRATLLANSEPFFAIAIAFFILGEGLTFAQGLGALLVLAGVMLPQLAVGLGHTEKGAPTRKP